MGHASSAISHLALQSGGSRAENVDNAASLCADPDQGGLRSWWLLILSVPLIMPLSQLADIVAACSAFRTSSLAHPVHLTHKITNMRTARTVHFHFWPRLKGRQHFQSWCRDCKRGQFGLVGDIGNRMGRNIKGGDSGHTGDVSTAHRLLG